MKREFDGVTSSQAQLIWNNGKQTSTSNEYFADQPPSYCRYLDDAVGGKRYDERGHVSFIIKFSFTKPVFNLI